ncbi:MAG: hypothetical protein HRT77_06195 [Halioglobus sp.]|nr:hypothetical protein [Halioglobus sp.]
MVLGVIELPGRHNGLLEPDYNAQLIADIQRDIRAALAKEPLQNPFPQVAEKASLLRFSLADRRVVIRVRCSGVGWSGREIAVAVEVTNPGEAAWLPFQQSGLLLVARWANKLGHRGHIVRRVRLTSTIKPGHWGRWTMQVWAPAKPGLWTLDIDIAKRGICLFQDMTNSKFHRAVLLLSL